MGCVIGGGLKTDTVSLQKREMLRREGHTVTTYEMLLSDPIRLHEKFIKNLEEEVNGRDT